MEQSYEIVRYPKIRHIRIFIDEIKYRSQHLHGDYELCFCLKGKGRFYFLDKSIELNEGEIIFLDSNETHSISSESEPFVNLFIQISNRFLSDYLPEMHSRRYACINLKDCLGNDEVKALFEQGIKTSLAYFQEADDYRLNTVGYVTALLHQIFIHVPNESLTNKEINARRKNAERLRRIIDYIDEHIQEKINQKEIADLEGITTAHLSHLFTSRLGISFQDYINERRLELAIRLMRNSSKGIIDISYESGFSDPKYMARLFRKRFNCSPKEFRKENILYPVSDKRKDDSILEYIYSEQEAILLAQDACARIMNKD
ncbi:MAG: AraC family transcriptional regulator [Bacilli bacterium]|nr:AraC family transcriptional regulator [Bacilli bacterium]